MYQEQPLVSWLLGIDKFISQPPESDHFLIYIFLNTNSMGNLHSSRDEQRLLIKKAFLCSVSCQIPDTQTFLLTVYLIISCVWGCVCSDLYEQHDVVAQS